MLIQIFSPSTWNAFQTGLTNTFNTIKTNTTSTLKIADAAGNETIQSSIVSVDFLNSLLPIVPFTPPSFATEPAPAPATQTEAPSTFGGTNSESTGEPSTSSESPTGGERIEGAVPTVLNWTKEPTPSAIPPIANSTILWGAAAALAVGFFVAETKKQREEEALRKIEAARAIREAAKALLAAEKELNGGGKGNKKVKKKAVVQPVLGSADKWWEDINTPAQPKPATPAVNRTYRPHNIPDVVIPVPNPTKPPVVVKPPATTSWLSSLAAGITSLGNAALSVGTVAINTVKTVVPAVASAVASTVKAVVTPVVNTVKAVMPAIVNTVKAIGAAAVNIVNTAVSVLTGLLSPAQNTSGGGKLAAPAKQDGDPPPPPEKDTPWYVDALNWVTSIPSKISSWWSGGSTPTPTPTALPTVPVWITHAPTITPTLTATPTITPTLMPTLTPTVSPTSTPLPTSPYIVENLMRYGIQTMGMTETQQVVILQAAGLSGTKFASLTGGTPNQAFIMSHGTIRIVVNANVNIEKGNCETERVYPGSRFWPLFQNEPSIFEGQTIVCEKAPTLTNVLHEFAHAFDNTYKAVGDPTNQHLLSDSLGDLIVGDVYLRQVFSGYIERTAFGFKGNREPALENSWTPSLSEEFADTYLNGVLDGSGTNSNTNGFAEDKYGDARRNDWNNLIDIWKTDMQSWLDSFGK